MIKYYITDDYVTAAFDVLENNNIPYTLDTRDFIVVNAVYETEVDNLFDKNFVVYKKTV